MIQIKTKERGYVLHEGDGFVVIATMKTTNRKTGDMVQPWILLRDVSPVEGVRTGLDADTVCDGCVLASGNGCYVNVGQAPLAVWKGYHANIYPYLEPREYKSVFANRLLRFGAYGNPSKIPLPKVKALAKACVAWTGYFHDWHSMPKRSAVAYGRYLMASTETEASRLHAKSLGLRYFHVAEDKPEETRECLADTIGLTCEQCRLCMGTTKKKQRSILINPHGSQKTKAVQAARG